MVSGLSNSSKSDTTCGLSSDQEGMRLGVHCTEFQKCNPCELLSSAAANLMKHVKTVHHKE